MRGVYVAQFRCTGVTGAKTLIYITAPSDEVGEILGVKVTQPGITSDEQLEFHAALISSLGTPTGTSVVPRPAEPGDQATSFTCKGNISANEPTYEVAPFGDLQGVPNRPGYFWDPIPEERPIIPPSVSYGLKLITTSLGSTYIFIAQITYRAIG